MTWPYRYFIVTFEITFAQLSLILISEYLRIAQGAESVKRLGFWLVGNLE